MGCKLQLLYDLISAQIEYRASFGSVNFFYFLENILCIFWGLFGLCFQKYKKLFSRLIFFFNILNQDYCKKKKKSPKYWVKIKLTHVNLI